MTLLTIRLRRLLLFKFYWLNYSSGTDKQHIFRSRVSNFHLDPLDAQKRRTYINYRAPTRLGPHTLSGLSIMVRFSQYSSLQVLLNQGCRFCVFVRSVQQDYYSVVLNSAKAVNDLLESNASTWKYLRQEGGQLVTDDRLNECVKWTAEGLYVGGGDTVSLPSLSTDT
ncbi:hypothetical protein BJ165DRAFT_639158 [Panaeolus papilionaceus]|nr:hypothetical protein BJ165DRAFT_639158 [Panaeolus papilionaceus]